MSSHADDIVGEYFESEDWAALAEEPEPEELELPPDADSAAA